MTTMPGLLDPLPLGQASRAPNRIVFVPHVTNLAEDGRPGERFTAYYERRARTLPHRLPASIGMSP